MKPGLIFFFQGSCGECDEKDLEENLTEVRLSSNSLQSKVAKLTSAATSLPPEPQTGGIEYVFAFLMLTKYAKS